MMATAMGTAAALAEPNTRLPREGRTRNSAVEGGWVPVAVLGLQRLAEAGDWTVSVSMAGRGDVMAVSGAASRDEAVEIAWQRLGLAAARIGREG